MLFISKKITFIGFFTYNCPKKTSFADSQFFVVLCSLPEEFSDSLVLHSAFAQSPICLRRLSIDSPSIVHQLSIETMENQWWIDGEDMIIIRMINESKVDDERKKNGIWPDGSRGIVKYVIIMLGRNNNVRIVWFFYKKFWHVYFLLIFAP